MDTLTKVSPVSAALRPRRELRFMQSVQIEDLIALDGFTGFQETRAHFEVDSHDRFLALDHISVSIPDFSVHMRLTESDVARHKWQLAELLAEDECSGYQHRVPRWPL